MTNENTQKIYSEQEYNELLNELNKYKLELKNNELFVKQNDEEKNNRFEEIMKRTSDAKNFFKEPKRSLGKIYIASSTDKQLINAYKIGRTTISIKNRVSSLQTSDPDIKILYNFKCKDVNFTEKYIHEYLDNLRLYKNREFFFFISRERCCELVKNFVDFTNKVIEEFDNDFNKLQEFYVKDSTKEIILVENKKSKEVDNKKSKEIDNEKSKEVDNKISKKVINKITEEVINKLNFNDNKPLPKYNKKSLPKYDEKPTEIINELKSIDIYKQYIDKYLKPSDSHVHTKTIYNHFCVWLRNNNEKNIPNNREFNDELRKNNLIIKKNIYVENKNSYGIKFLQIINK